MKNRVLYLSITLMAMGFVACNPGSTASSERQKLEASINYNTKDMNSFVSIFEIPATDVPRAISFYQAILGIKIEKMEFPGVEMGLFPYEEQTVTGVIMKAEGNQPSADGVTIYLNGGNDLQVILDRIEKSGGKILIPKTPHADEVGYFAIFIDSEGNKLGLHSPN